MSKWRLVPHYYYDGASLVLQRRRFGIWWWQYSWAGHPEMILQRVTEEIQSCGGPAGFLRKQKELEAEQRRQDRERYRPIYLGGNDAEG